MASIMLLIGQTPTSQLQRRAVHGGCGEQWLQPLLQLASASAITSCMLAKLHSRSVSPRRIVGVQRIPSSDGVPGLALDMSGICSQRRKALGAAGLEAMRDAVQIF